MDPIFTSKRRQPAVQTDFRKCIICQLDSGNHDLNYLTKNGIETFKNALRIRKDEVHDRMLSEVDNIDVFFEKKPLCHRNCRSRYTHKKELEKYAFKRMKMEDEDETSLSASEMKTTSRSGQTIDFKTCCFLCNKKRDPKGNWQLTLVSTETRQQAIHEKAKYLNDEELLVKIQGHGNQTIDMIAADFRYHKSCMDNFMNKKLSAVIKENDYDLAFSELASEISESLIKDQSAFYTTQLLTKYRGYLAKQGVQNVGSYRSGRLQKRLLDHFGTDIQIVAQKGKASLVCSANITVREMCALAAKLQGELDKSETQTESDESDEDTAEDAKKSPALVRSDLFAVAKHLRGKMKEKEKESRSENDSLEITYEAASEIIPDDLYNHLAWIMYNSGAELSETGRVILPEHQDRKVVSIAQELMANTTTMPMPMHVGLSLYILKQTGSKELVRILNKFGLAISYDDAQRYISTDAHEVDLQTIENGVFIPSEIVPGRFTQCVLDNLDFHENTKDGSTLHATSHAILQYPDDNSTSRSSVSVPLEKRRRKTVEESESMTVTETDISLKDRREARSVSGVPLASQQGQPTSLIADEHFVWTLIRLLVSRDDGDTTAPTWNEFHEILSGNEAPKPRTVIGYGPLFPQSPTDPAVVQASLDYFMLLTRKLGQDTTVVTADQAIYDIVKGK